MANPPQMIITILTQTSSGTIAFFTLVNSEFDSPLVFASVFMTKQILFLLLYRVKRSRQDKTWKFPRHATVENLERKLQLQ